MFTSRLLQFLRDMSRSLYGYILRSRVLTSRRKPISPRLVYTSFTRAYIDSAWEFPATSLTSALVISASGLLVLCRLINKPWRIEAAQSALRTARPPSGRAIADSDSSACATSGERLARKGDWGGEVGEEIGDREASEAVETLARASAGKMHVESRRAAIRSLPRCSVRTPNNRAPVARDKRKKKR